MDKVVHFEIEADNLKRAVKFYRDVFGWNIFNSQMPGVEYFLVHSGPTDKKGMAKEPGFINGGIQKRIGQVKNGAIIVMNVKNLNASLKKIQKKGGKVVMPKMKVGDMGLYARVTDTEGNIIGIWQDLK